MRKAVGYSSSAEVKVGRQINPTTRSQISDPHRALMVKSGVAVRGRPPQASRAAEPTTDVSPPPSDLLGPIYNRSGSACGRSASAGVCGRSASSSSADPRPSSRPIQTFDEFMMMSDDEDGNDCERRSEQRRRRSEQRTGDKLLENYNWSKQMGEFKCRPSSVAELAVASAQALQDTTVASNHSSAGPTATQILATWAANEMKKPKGEEIETQHVLQRNYEEIVRVLSSDLEVSNRRVKDVEAELGLCTSKLLTSEHRVDSLMTELSSLRNENSALRADLAAPKDTDQCVICLSETACCAMVPCGHLALCGECCGQMPRCPVCRQAVQTVIRIYRP